MVLEDKTMKKLLALLLLNLLLVKYVSAQGCVVAHGTGMPNCTLEDDNKYSYESSISYRWFESNRDYIGTNYNPLRNIIGDQIINHSHFVDISLKCNIFLSSTVDVTVPFVYHTRSQAVKNSSGVVIGRYTNTSSGIADITIIAKHLLLPSNPKGNIQLGVGVSLPSGNDATQGTFQSYNNTTKTITYTTHANDQSIQPGSGGYGIVTSFYGYRKISSFTFYIDGTYTMTPQSINNVQTARSNTYEQVMSIPDFYQGRVGVEYNYRNVTLSLGERIEGVPVYDLVGYSSGFRRPGYSLDLDPGIRYNGRRWTTSIYTPISQRANRLQSRADKLTTALTGKYTQGDAFFAPYEIIGSVSYKF